MAEKLPLVYVDGGLSQLPPGDSIEGVQLGTLTAGSGLVGGGDLNTGNKRLDVALASNASGVIFVGDAIGLDGVAEATATEALASGNAGLVLGETALSSGVVAQGEAATALASGNAALEAAVNFVGSSSLELTAASPISIGSAVGLDDTGSVQSVREIVDADSRSFGSPVVFESANSNYFSPTYDSTNNRVVIAYRDIGNSGYGTAIVGTVSGTSISFGTAVVFESADSSFNSTTYDSTNNRVVIAYQDAGNSYRGTAIVGTVSGTSISFGTAVVFESGISNSISATYDTTNNRVVIAYRDVGNSSYGTAIVGTVSGTSISFGTAVVFESANSPYISSVYDSTNNRVVIAYRDIGNSNYGTAIVGTVSGTSISFGTAVVFESAGSEYISATYDSTNNRVVIAYRDTGNSNYGTAIVGTVSGTSISFGTAVVFEAANSLDISTTFDSTNNRVVIAYRDNGNSNYGTAIVGTVSGTSISFGTAVVFESAYSDQNSATYDSTNNRVVIAYRDVGNSSYGTAIIAAPDTTIAPTISSQTNFLGIAQATVASGADVNVLLPRVIDTNQTGLTPGYFYYVDAATSGFTTASGQPSAWSGAYNWGPVGKAVSSSGLLLLNPL
jgi:hypothetical protein